jgi:DNA repair photolyase
MAEVLDAARSAGATGAGYVLLRLPGSVKNVFETRIRAALPLRAEKIMHRIRETRNGALYDSRFGLRGRGEGHYAQAINQVFRTTKRRLGFDDDAPFARPDTFRRPEKRAPQLSLFT